SDVRSRGATKRTRITGRKSAHAAHTVRALEQAITYLGAGAQIGFDVRTRLVRGMTVVADTFMTHGGASIVGNRIDAAAPAIHFSRRTDQLNNLTLSLRN